MKHGNHPFAFERAMTPFRSSLVCVLVAAVGACHGDAVTNSPNPALAAITFANAVPDTNKMAFRVVDIVSNAVLVGATFRSGNLFPMAIEAGTRHIRVFFDTSDVVWAQKVLLDTTYTFTADQHYSFTVTGFARSGPLRALIVADAAPPTVPAGKFAIRILNLAPSFAGAVPALADTTVLPDAFVRRQTALPGGSPEAANVGYLAASPYALLDTGRTYRVALTATGTTGPVILQAPVLIGVAGTATLNPIAGSAASGSVLTAVIVPRSVTGSTAPQGGRPGSKAVEFATRSNDTVTVQSGSVTIVTNRSGGKADTTIANTGTGTSAGVTASDNILVTGATQPEYNGWQTVIQVADSVSCNPVSPTDTPTKCAAANDTATTRFRFRYRITGVPVSPATGTVIYRVYPVSASAADFTIPYIMYLVDRRPPDTTP